MLELTLIHVSKKGLDCIKIGKVWSIRIYPNHFQKQKRKSDVSFSSCIQICKKMCFPQKR